MFCDLTGAGAFGRGLHTQQRVSHDQQHNDDDGAHDSPPSLGSGLEWDQLGEGRGWRSGFVVKTYWISLGLEIVNATWKLQA